MQLNPNSIYLIPYLLHLADTTLILAQRNSEWCGHGPVLEQDIAITNISLDLLGQSRNFYQYAAQLINENSNNEQSKAFSFGEGLGEVTEDSLAYLRTEREYKNLLIVEQPNGDWAQTILRQYLFSQFQFLLFQQLQNNGNAQLSAITTKALKEIAYHVRWTSEWVIRLGDGTDESNARMLHAVEELKNYTGEFFIAADYEKELGIDVSLIKHEWENEVKSIYEEATLPYPENSFNQTGGKNGFHSEYLGLVLAEMQHLQRVYPGANW